MIWYLSCWRVQKSDQFSDLLFHLRFLPKCARNHLQLFINSKIFSVNAIPDTFQPLHFPSPSQVTTPHSHRLSSHNHHMESSVSTSAIAKEDDDKNTVQVNGTSKEEEQRYEQFVLGQSLTSVLNDPKVVLLLFGYCFGRAGWWWV